MPSSWNPSTTFLLPPPGWVLVYSTNLHAWCYIYDPDYQASMRSFDGNSSRTSNVVPRPSPLAHLSSARSTHERDSASQRSFRCEAHPAGSGGSCSRAAGTPSSSSQSPSGAPLTPAPIHAGQTGSETSQHSSQLQQYSRSDPTPSSSRTIHEGHEIRPITDGRQHRPLREYDNHRADERITTITIRTNDTGTSTTTTIAKSKRHHHRHRD